MMPQFTYRGFSGSMAAGQSFSPALSWIPSENGIYTATAFFWESLDDPTALHSSMSLTMNVGTDGNQQVISTGDSSQIPITYRIQSSSGDIITIGEMYPDVDGSFSEPIIFTVASLFKSFEKYTVTAQYGDTESTTVFSLDEIILPVKQSDLIDSSDISQSNTAQSNTDQSNTAQSNTAQSNTAQSNTAQSNTAQSNTAQSNTAQSNTAQSNTAQSNTAQSNTAQSNTAQSNTAQSNTAQSNTAQSNTAQSNTAQSNTAQSNTAQSNTAQSNTAQSNTAQSNTATNDSVITTTEPTCGFGTSEINGICKVVSQSEPACGPGTQSVNGYCQVIPITEPTCGQGTVIVNGYCQVIKNNNIILKFFSDLFS